MSTAKHIFKSTLFIKHLIVAAYRSRRGRYFVFKDAPTAVVVLISRLPKRPDSDERVNELIDEAIQERRMRRSAILRRKLSEKKETSHG